MGLMIAVKSRAHRTLGKFRNFTSIGHLEAIDLGLDLPDAQPVGIYKNNIDSLQDSWVIFEQGLYLRKGNEW